MNERPARGRVDCAVDAPCAIGASHATDATRVVDATRVADAPCAIGATRAVWAARAVFAALAACLLLAVLGVIDYRFELARRKAVMADGLLSPPDVNSPKALDVYHQAVAAGLFRELARQAPDILFLNDSVMGGHGDYEPRTPMDELLAAALNGGAEEEAKGEGQKPLTVRGISGAGYTALVYERYAQLVARSPHKPRVVILPINPRSFSSPWFFGEDYWYARVLRFLPIVAETPSLQWWLLRMVDRVNGRDPDEVAGRPLGDSFKVPTVANYFRSFRFSASDYGPPPPGFDEERLAAREHFIENYGQVCIVSDHPMLITMNLAVQWLTAAGVTPLVYVTPVDIEEGERLLGPLFAKRFTDAMARIRGEMERQKVAFLDLSGLLGSRFFVDREYACEHLNLAGREAVALELARAVRPMLGR